MKRLSEIDRAVAVACGADELRTLGARQQQLQPFGGKRFIVGNQIREAGQSQPFVSTGIVSDTLNPPPFIGP